MNSTSAKQAENIIKILYNITTTIFFQQRSSMDSYNKDRQKGKVKNRRSGKDRRLADDNIFIGTDRRSGIERRKVNKHIQNKNDNKHA